MLKNSVMASLVARSTHSITSRLRINTNNLVKNKNLFKIYMTWENKFKIFGFEENSEVITLLMQIL